MQLTFIQLGLKIMISWFIPALYNRREHVANSPHFVLNVGGVQICFRSKFFKRDIWCYSVILVTVILLQLVIISCFLNAVVKKYQRMDLFLWKSNWFILVKDCIFNPNSPHCLLSGFIHMLLIIVWYTKN